MADIVSATLRADPPPRAATQGPRKAAGILPAFQLEHHAAILEADMKHYSAAEIPLELVGLVRELMPKLLSGDHPTLLNLRMQWKHASIEKAQFSGVGFFVDISVPESIPSVEPANFCGGDARSDAQGVKHGAGGVLYVEGGRLS